MSRVKDLMSHALDVMSADAHLHDVLIKMIRAGYRDLPVVTDDKLVGTTTDRDLRLAVNSPVVEGELISNAKRSLTKSRSINA